MACDRGAPWQHVLASIEPFGALAVASAYVPPRARDLPPDEVPYHRERIEELHEHTEQLVRTDIMNLTDRLHGACP